MLAKDHSRFTGDKNSWRYQVLSVSRAPLSQERFVLDALAKVAAVIVILSLVLLLACFSYETAYADESAHPVSVSEYAGRTQVDTAVLQSRATFSTSDWVILVGSLGWPDALSSAGLAGALDCPILYSEAGKLSQATADEISRLGVSNILLVGGSSVLSAEVESSLASYGHVERLFGSSQYDTQMAVFEYGMSKGLWSKDMLFVASGVSFADALSIAPVAYAHAAPLFLVNNTRDLSDVQKQALIDAAGEGYFTQTCGVVGGTVMVSESTEGFVSFVSTLSSGHGDRCLRLAGETMFDTNIAVAEWAVAKAGMKWNGVAFASANVPYDALAGSAMQGKKDSLVLLVRDAYSGTVATAAQHAGAIANYSLFGGSGIISDNLRKYINYSVRFGYALPMGATRLSDRSYIWCDSSGVYREDSAYYGAWIDRANWYSSLTNWLILVDTSSNQVAIFYGSKGSWAVQQLWSCTSGAWSTPTVRGEFSVGTRGLSFGSGYTCWYWTQFYGNYLFHSVLYQPGSMTRIQDGRLGINASHGCVRLDINNAKWIFDNIPRYTKVVTY